MGTRSKLKKPLLILHGYSDTSESFRPLARFLKGEGFPVVEIWLADYLSMNDEITIYDLAQAMGAALKREKIPESPKSFDLIAHSTGGLVVRAYLRHYFYGRPEASPIHHLVLLAPANFGSPLAALGKSMAGRLFNGWDWDHFFQTGTRILQALELASPISWELAHRDLFDPENPLFRRRNLYTTVLIGTEPYENRLRRLTHENGSDGVVRVSTANLNAKSFRLSFPDAKKPALEELPPQYDPIAFGVLPGRNHGSIVRPDDRSSGELGKWILESLKVETDAAYQDHVERLSKLTQAAFSAGRKSKETALRYHEYQTVTARARDQFGETISDYFLEFFQERGDREDRVMEQVHSRILESVKRYSENPSYRAFLFDVTDLEEMILQKGREVDLSIAVAAKSERIFYRNPKGFILAAGPTARTLVAPNAAVFLDVTVERLQSEKVFQLAPFSP